MEADWDVANFEMIPGVNISVFINSITNQVALTDIRYSDELNKSMNSELKRRQIIAAGGNSIQRVFADKQLNQYTLDEWVKYKEARKIESINGHLHPPAKRVVFGDCRELIR